MKELSFSFRNNGPIKLDIKPKDIEFEDLLFDENNKPIKTKNSVFFCRCGRSPKQPYCDGTHKKVGFTSNKEIDKEIIQEYKGEDINITFNRSICSGAASCVHNFSKIYSSENSNDWIRPDNDSVEEVIKSIENCPSGALSFSLNGICTKESYEKPTLHIIKKGPLIVKGDISLEGVLFATNANVQKYTLCRCGASENKPFCDYSHAVLKEESYTF